VSGPDVDGLLVAFRADLSAATDLDALDSVRRAHCGKKSPVKLALRGLRDVPSEDRPAVAAAIHGVRATIDDELGQVRERLEASAVASRLDAEWADLSMPGLATPRGALHPVTVVERRCMEMMRQLGFVIERGPEVERPFYNFDALNIPEHHPARDMQDTFWVEGGLVLRSHTTTIQARVLESKPQLPIRVAAFGRVYRNEAVDATHLAMFHQFECIWVDRGLTFGHLKGLLGFIARSLYGEDKKIRFKPKFYPYTEPSVGVDISCGGCEGDGCDACHGAGWVTILGAGMVHPKVFTQFGYDPAEVSGVAFGMGTSRMAAQYSGVTKVRSLYEQDLRVHEALHRGGR